VLLALPLPERLALADNALNCALVLSALPLDPPADHLDVALELRDAPRGARELKPRGVEGRLGARQLGARLRQVALERGHHRRLGREL
jgi:hypothetical protein